MLDQFLRRKFSFQVNITVGGLVIFFFLLLFFSYLGWEFYWFTKIGLYFIKWHTRIVFSALFYGIVLFIPTILFAFFKTNKTSKSAFTIALGIWLGLMTLEIGLAILGINRTYSEERTGAYQSPFELNPSNYYHVYKPYDSITSKSPEFSYTSTYNALGYLGENWPKIKKAHTRIIIFGDSFTEGDGAPMDSCYPSKLEEILGDSFEVFNAGVRGSDPVYGLKNMEDKLFEYRPDIVIQAVSENDVLYDFCIRGGFERFQNNGTLKFKTSPFWEPFYALSYSGRIFFNLFGKNISEPCGGKENFELQEKGNRILKEVCNRYEILGRKNHFKTYILFYPTKFEVLKNEWFFDYSKIKKYISTLTYVSYLDIFPCYHQKMKQLKMDPTCFYWKIDGHHNATGYALMAECVSETLQEAENSK